MNLSEYYKYKNKCNNLEIYNVLANSTENIINKNENNYKMNNCVHEVCKKYNSSEKKNIKNENSNIAYLDKNIDKGEHYNVKNININFNNIKVVNNISKKIFKP